MDNIQLSEDAKRIAQKFFDQRSILNESHKELMASLYVEAFDAEQSIVDVLNEKKYIVNLKDILAEDEIKKLLSEYPSVIKYCYEYHSMFFEDRLELPKELVELCLSFVNVKDDKKVFLPFAGEAQFAFYNNRNADYCGFEKDSESWALAQILLSSTNIKAEITQNTSTISNDFDYLFCSLIGVNVETSIVEQLYDAIVNHITDNGSALCILPTSFYYSDKWKKIRSIIVRKEYESVLISLPIGTPFHHLYQYPACILLLKKGKNKSDSIEYYDFAHEEFIARHHMLGPILKINTIIETIELGDDNYLKYIPIPELNDDFIINLPRNREPYRCIMLRTTPYDNKINDMARMFNLELKVVDTWEELNKVLYRGYREISAIILEEKSFHKNRGLLLRFWGEKKTLIPYYVLFDNEISHEYDYANGDRELEWEALAYSISEEDESKKESILSLFKNIKNNAYNINHNKILYIFEAIFKYLGNGRIIVGGARDLMLKMLSGLYSPEDIYNLSFEEPPLRKVIEALFQSAKRNGVLYPENLNREQNNRPNITNAYKFLTGSIVKIDDKRKVKWQGKSILNDIYKPLIDFSQRKMHGGEQFLFSEGENIEFFCYLMMVAQMIREYGNFIEKNSDKNKNEKNIKYISEDDMEYYNNEIVNPEEDSSGIWHFGKCRLDDSYRPKRRVRLYQLRPNNNKEKDGYSFYARYDYNIEK